MIPVYVESQPKLQCSNPDLQSTRHVGAGVDKSLGLTIVLDSILRTSNILH